jgi:hypothetical protein
MASLYPQLSVVRNCQMDVVSRLDPQITGNLRPNAETGSAYWPQYTEEEPEIYEQETLDKFFATTMSGCCCSSSLMICAPCSHGWVILIWHPLSLPASAAGRGDALEGRGDLGHKGVKSLHEHATRRSSSSGRRTAIA